MVKPEDSESEEVMTNCPCVTVYAQFPAAAVAPVTYARTTEFGWMYSSVMVHEFPPAPHVVVLMSLYASGGRDDCGDCFPTAISLDV